MIREGSLRLPFRYAAGRIASRFLVALRDDARLLGARCVPCGRIVAPPPSFCAGCGEALEELVEVGPGGRLVSFCERADGQTFCLVRLDGADGAMLHHLVGAPGDGRGWRLGERVVARFAPERCGSILDLAGFESVSEQEP